MFVYACETLFVIIISFLYYNIEEENDELRCQKRIYKNKIVQDSRKSLLNFDLTLYNLINKYAILNFIGKIACSFLDWFFILLIFTYAFLCFLC